MGDKIGFSKPCQLSLWLKQLWEDQLFDILMMVNSGELMQSLVARDGFLVLCGDVFLETISFLYCICIKSFGSSLLLIWKHAHHCLQCVSSSDILMHGVYISHEVYAGGYVHQLVKAGVQLLSHLTLFLCLGECTNRWDCMCTHNNIQAYKHQCMGSLQTSDELQEFLIVSDMTSDAHLQLIYHGLHHLG